MTTGPKDEKAPRDEDGLTLNKETLDDLDAPEGTAEEAKGGAANNPTSTPFGDC